MDPATLAFLPQQGSLGASGFFFPFNYGLHLHWLEIGKWLVGAAGMAMLLLLASGVVIHRKISANSSPFGRASRCNAAVWICIT
jgi:uncharacterized iron-regulated membrane protein